ncbi:MAG: phosphatidate cytidylyltransferase [Magnetococcales bacterium]|nr:phosphatidate cytidylyltransferase [Magnetococcales bacterium]
MNAPVLIRTLSALLLAIPLLYLLLAGSPGLLFLLVVPVAALLVHEWHRLREPPLGREDSLRRFLPLLFGVLLILVSGVPKVGWLAALPSLPLSLSCMLLLLFFFAEGVWHYQPGRSALEDICRRYFGVLYCALPLALLLDVRQGVQGGVLICFLLLIIWATDVGAFFAGRRWGERKLAPLISPGKTLAGFWGGVVLASLTGGILSFLLSLFEQPFPYDWPAATLLGAVLSVVGQVGDLAESLLKREAGVKDSGHLIPGHGGMLDRLDSLLFAAPVYYLFLWMQPLSATPGALFLGG